MAQTQIYGVFDSRAAAQRARERLDRMGIAPDCVTIADRDSAEQTIQSGDGGGGFWSHVKSMFMPNEDRATIDESLRRGDSVVIATISEAQHDPVMAALEEEGAVDLDERETQWRASGWNPDTQRSGAEVQRSADAQSSDVRTAGSERLAGDGGPEGVAIPVVEEKLRVGKREIQRGGKRVRSFIVEEPVHEDVQLRQEHVDVERRPVNAPTRPVAKGSPEDLMQERTVELTERGEQAVVGKEAVVTEEVRLRKRADERTERIEDKVRRTEVEVDDLDAGPQASPGSPPGSKRT
ncbi:MAG TPA: YsnF/AvaK domain-containing protein [Steroidobacteraceae bacterium]|nr:YsnF/AvaK domain-containing protein [Steroidobacteraceae bacterium]